MIDANIANLTASKVVSIGLKEMLKLVEVSARLGQFYFQVAVDVPLPVIVKLRKLGFKATCSHNSTTVSWKGGAL